MKERFRKKLKRNLALVLTSIMILGTIHNTSYASDEEQALPVESTTSITDVDTTADEEIQATTSSNEDSSEITTTVIPDTSVAVEVIPVVETPVAETETFVEELDATIDENTFATTEAEIENVTTATSTTIAEVTTQGTTKELEINVAETEAETQVVEVTTSPTDEDYIKSATEDDNLLESSEIKTFTSRLNNFIPANLTAVSGNIITNSETARTSEGGVKNEGPVIGKDHPTNPGDVMLFKEVTKAKDANGKDLINTWDIKLRMETLNKKPNTSIVLVIDRSGSMEDTSGGTNTKLQDAKIAAELFLDTIFAEDPTNTKVGVVSFASRHINRNDGNYLDYNASIASRDYELGTSEQKNLIINKINTLTSGGGTNTQAGLYLAQQMLQADKTADVKHIILLSDGVPTTSLNEDANGDLYEIGSGYEDNSNIVVQIPKAIGEADVIKDQNTIIHSIALAAGEKGTPTLESISSPDKAYSTLDSTELTGIFKTIASDIIAGMKDVEVIDPMGLGFEVEAGSVANITTVPPQDPTAPTVHYNSETNNINWNPGTVSTPVEGVENVTYAELNYRVEINEKILSAPGDESGTFFMTNGDAGITFTDIEGNKQEVLFPKPQVDPVLWTLEKVLLDHEGDQITSGIGDFTIHVTPQNEDKSLSGDPVVKLLNPKTGDKPTDLITDLRIQSFYQVDETSQEFGVATEDDFLELTVDKQYTFKFEDTVTRDGTIIKGTGGEFVPIDTTDTSTSNGDPQSFKVFIDEDGNPSQDVSIRVTNQLKPIKIQINKIWEDESDTDRPETITFHIKNGETLVEELTMSKTDKSVVSGDLPRLTNNGERIIYTVKEIQPDTMKYEVIPGVDNPATAEDFEGVGPVEFEFTNKQEVIEKSVEKVWINNTRDENPTEVTVNLLQNGKFFEKVVLDAGKEWKHTWTGLPEFDKEGNPYNYTLEEVTVPGYSSAINEETGEITNTKTTTEIPVTKVWEAVDGEDLPEKITINLLRDGEEIATQTLVNPDWSFTFKVDKDGKDLAKIDPTGKEYVYTITEDEVVGYTSEIADYKVINTQNTINLEVTKTWFDESLNLDRPESIEIILNKNDKEYKRLELTQGDDENSWTGSFTGLPEYDENGESYKYTIDEVLPAGYEKVVDGFSVTNTRILTEIPVTKVWEAVEGEDLPEEITLRLLRDGEEIATQTLVNPDWSFTFVEDAEGKKLAKTNPTTREDYIYTITEDEVVGYTSEIADYKVVNTQNTINLEVRKTWFDESLNLDRPESIEIILNKNSKEYKRLELTQGDDENSWTGSFTGLPEYDETGELYEYTIDEVLPAGYEKVVDGFSVTNTRILTEIPVTKEWEAVEGEDLPAEITIRLLRDGVEIAAQTLVNPDWSFTFVEDAEGKKLAKTNPTTGEDYVYTIIEDEVVGYTSVITDYKIVNTQITKDVQVDKIWINGPMPNVAIELRRSVNGIEDADFVRMFEASKEVTSMTFTDLAVFSPDGIEYFYYAVEPTVPADYEKTESGTSVTNEYIVPKTSVMATKEWIHASENLPTIWFKLYRTTDGTTFEAVPEAEILELAAGVLEVEWTDIDKTDLKGTAYVFSVVEVDAEGNDYVPSGFIKVEEGLRVQNTYEARGSWQAKASKELAGRELEDGEFEFELKDEDGNVIGIAKNNAAGEILFDPVDFDELAIGESFNYTITELKSDLENITSDDLVITVLVTVVDAGEGTLEFDVVYSEDTVFNNTFTPEPTTEPTTEPTPEPTTEPTTEPTLEPTTEPTTELTPEPTPEPAPEATPEKNTEPVPETKPEPKPEKPDDVAKTGETLYLGLPLLALFIAALLIIMRRRRNR